MPHLLLQLEDAVHQRLARGRAAGHVDVHRHDPVAAPRHAVAVVVVAAAVGAGAHADDPARVGHLVVDLAQGGRHLVGEGAGDDHDVRLARRGAEDDAQPVLVVARRGQVHHLDGAAGQAEGHGPEGGLAGPICYLVEGRSGIMRQLNAAVFVLLDTHNAYCITPSFFSWLGSGTSRRGFPVTPSGGPSFDCVCNAVALFGGDVDMQAAGTIVRKGMRAVEGLALEGVSCLWQKKGLAIALLLNRYLVETVKPLI